MPDPHTTLDWHKQRELQRLREEVQRLEDTLHRYQTKAFEIALECECRAEYVEAMGQRFDPLPGHYTQHAGDLRLVVQRLRDMSRKSGGHMSNTTEDEFIERFFVVSTAHLDKASRDQLVDAADYRGSSGPVCYSFEYGWFVFAHDTDQHETLDLTPCLRQVMAKTLERGCRYVMFDSDAMEYPDLPTYEW